MSKNKIEICLVILVNVLIFFDEAWYIFIIDIVGHPM
jgi:hypothetical protein